MSGFPLVFCAGSQELASFSALPKDEFRFVFSETQEAPAAVVLELGSDEAANRLLLKESLRRFRSPLLAIVPRGCLKAAVAAVRDGAADSLEAPVDAETLRRALRGVLPPPPARSSLESPEGVRTSLGPIIGSAPCMQSLYKRILSASSSDATVFIQGPSGTGKELVAKALHLNSPRAAAPFIAINCGAIPPNLLESELFGHERGSFTGAEARHEGKFEQAEKGSLFLDEIAELPLDLQVKLLRVLQEMAVTRVGGKELVPVDVRIICATNRDLKQLLAKGLFREDLYYRLNVVPINTPALSARRQDIPLLLNHFLSIFSDKYGKYMYDFSREAMARLCAYSWPGNVREMENLVERIVVLHDGRVVEESFLPEEILAQASAPAWTAPSLSSTRVLDTQSVTRRSIPPQPGEFPLVPLREAEAALIKAALARTAGNIVQAAKLLDIGQATVYRKLRKYGIDPRRFKPSL